MNKERQAGNPFTAPNGFEDRKRSLLFDAARVFGRNKLAVTGTFIRIVRK